MRLKLSSYQNLTKRKREEGEVRGEGEEREGKEKVEERWQSRDRRRRRNYRAISLMNIKNIPNKMSSK